MGKTKVKTKKARVLDHDEYFLKECSELVQMLSYPRPSGHMEDAVYTEFLDRFIVPTFGEPDKHGNYIHIVLDETLDDKLMSGYPEELGVSEQFPHICYAAHHDTVHNSSTLAYAPFDNRIMYHPTQTEEELVAEKLLAYKGHTKNYKPFVSEKEKLRAVELFVSKPDKIKVREITQTYAINPEDEKDIKHISLLNKVVEKEVDDPSQGHINCLGADCTSGIWLILEMIRAKTPGVYIIHAEEEVGRKGAEALIKDFVDHNDDKEATGHNPYYWIDLIDAVISFDRKGTDEIITHQSGRERCASDAFADSLSDLLSPSIITGGYKTLVKSDRGSFTDSYSYRKHVPECINLCVGYNAQHSSNETQDIKFLVNMRNSLILNGHTMNDPNGPIVIERDHTFQPKSYTSPHNYNNSYGGNNYGHNSNYNYPPNDIYGHEWDEFEEADKLLAQEIRDAQKKSSNRTSAPPSGKTTPSKNGKKTSKSSTSVIPISKGSSLSIVEPDDDFRDNYDWDNYDVSDFGITNPLQLFQGLIGQGATFTDQEQQDGVSVLLSDYNEELASYFIAYGIGIEELVEFIANEK